MSRVLSPPPYDEQIGKVFGSRWSAFFRDAYKILKEPWKYDATYSGTATLSSGTIVVNNTNVKASSKFLLTAQNTSANAGHLYISNINAGSSFTIASSDGSDDRIVFYEIREAL